MKRTYVRWLEIVEKIGIEANNRYFRIHLRMGDAQAKTSAGSNATTMKGNKKVESWPSRAIGWLREKKV